MGTSLRRGTLLCLPFAVVVASGCGITRSHPSRSDPSFLSAWIRTLYGAVRVERLTPPVASRIAAYASIALYSGIAAVHHDLPPLDGELNGMPDLPRANAGDAKSYDATVVAVSAERVVMDSLFREALPTTVSALSRLADSLVNARVTDGLSPDGLAMSDRLGREIGLRIVAWSNTDGFDTTRTLAYSAAIADSLWINDSPASNFTSQNLSGASEFISLSNPANKQSSENASDRGLILSRPKSSGGNTLPAVDMSGATEPHWGEIRPFVLKSWRECKLAPPPRYTKDSLSDLYRDAREVMSTRSVLTADQRHIALYWADNPGETGTPVGHWLSIAGQMISERNLSTNEAVRLLLATAVAQADAFIAGFGYKYYYMGIRPRTYIKRVIDSAWEPLISTPPFPEYPSGHSTQSAAASAAMTAVIGVHPFTDSTSISLGHAVRSFASFHAASEEAGASRVYGGIHFPSGHTAGQTLGTCVGDIVVERLHLISR